MNILKMQKNLKVPYLCDADSACTYIKREAVIDMPFDPAKLGYISSDPDLHVEFMQGYYLRSKKIPVLCIELKKQIKTISSNNNSDGLAEYIITEFKYKEFVYGVELSSNKTIFFVDFYASSLDISELPDILKLLYYKADPNYFDYNAVIAGSVKNPGRKSINFRPEAYPEFFDEQKIAASVNPSLPHFNSTVNEEYSDFFEGDARLMSDDEFHGLNGYER